LRTPLIIALAATLVGCSRQPPPQAATESCTDQGAFACFKSVAADRPIERASLTTNFPTKETRFGVATDTESQPSDFARNSAARPVVRKSKPTTVTANAELPATPIPLPRPLSRTQRETRSSNASPDPGATEPDGGIRPATVGRSPNSNGRTIQEQVAAATAVAEQTTIRAAAAPRTGAEPGGPPSNTDLLVAIVMVRLEIRSVSDLTGKNVAIDERYSPSSVDVRIAIVAAGAPEVQLSAAPTTAIDRLVNGEVPAAVVALVSADSAADFPEIAGFRTLQVPLSPRSSKTQR
jgi:hypothetical protein